MSNLEGDSRSQQEQQYSPNTITGPGPTKQAKRLQLRKIGFRAKVLPTRNVTPNPKTSSSWSTSDVSSAAGSNIRIISGLDGASDTPEPNERAGVLSEINNSSRRRKRQSTRPRVDEQFSIFQDENLASHMGMSPRRDMSSEHSKCMTPDSASRSRTASVRHQRTHSKRYSEDLEAAKYIEHLEAELAAVQTQLSAMTSPTVLQARSQKMRALNTEIRGLQEEVAEWEAKFHQRVQEEIEERNQIEANLKARIRSLENDSDEHVRKVRDLQIQLEASLANNAMAETTNEEMEKRINAFSDLISSPKKMDINGFPSSTRKRHNRNKSTLPRFPTTNSLAFSFKPQEQAIPTTPLPATARASEQIATGFEFLQQNDATLAALTSSASDDGITHSVALSDPPSGNSLKRWSTPEAFNMTDHSMLPSTGKHPRRMRRFHATNMPKPLLLPQSASGLHNLPSTAPPMEKHESPAAFPFPTLPDVSEVPTSGYDMFMSPLPSTGRRRARTSADGIDLALRRTSSPFFAAITPETSSSESKMVATSPDVAVSEDTPRDYSSLGSAIGRNLLEELERAKDAKSTMTSDLESELRQVSGPSEDTTKPHDLSSPMSRSRRASSNGNSGLRRRSWTCHQHSLSDQSGLPPFGDGPCSRDGHVDTKEDQEEQRMRNFLQTLWRQLYDTARQSLQYAQSVTLRSNTVQKLQWWLVQLFLGPQVTRRMMASSMRLPRRSIESPELRNLSLTPTGRGSKQNLAAELDMFSERAIRRSERRFDPSTQRNEWLTRHSLWTWMRFSLTMAFAVGAAIRDGPAAVMGEEDTRNA